MIAVVRAGARGYVTKSISGEELAAAIAPGPRRRRRLLAAARGLRARRLRRIGPGGRDRPRARPADDARARGPAPDRPRLHVQGGRPAARHLARGPSRPTSAPCSASSSSRTATSSAAGRSSGASSIDLKPRRTPTTWGAPPWDAPASSSRRVGGYLASSISSKTASPFFSSMLGLVDRHSLDEVVDGAVARRRPRRRRRRRRRRRWLVVVAVVTSVGVRARARVVARRSPPELSPSWSHSSPHLTSVSSSTVPVIVPPLSRLIVSVVPSNEATVPAFSSPSSTPSSSVSSSRGSLLGPELAPVVELVAVLVALRLVDLEREVVPLLPAVRDLVVVPVLAAAAGPAATSASTSSAAIASTAVSERLHVSPPWVGGPPVATAY